MNQQPKYRGPSTNSYAADYGYGHDFGFNSRELKATRKDLCSSGGGNNMLKIYLIITLLTITLLSRAQQNKVTEAYVNANSFILQNNLTNIISIFDKYSFFVIGERHGGQVNYDIFKSFIEYLNERYGVKHIIIEEGFSRSMLINLFLKTKNEKIIDFLKKYSIKQDLLFINWLKEYNENKPDSLKIILHGVDYEQRAEQVMLINLLYFLLPNNEAPEQISDIMIRLRNINSLYFTERVQLVNDLIKSSKNDSSIYKKYFMTDYHIFKEALDRWNSSLKLQGFNYNLKYDSTLFLDRERFIFNNIIALSKDYPDERFLAKFGVGHIGLNSFLFQSQTCKTFVSLLDQESNSVFYNNVASLFINYKGIRRRKYSKEFLGKELYFWIKRISYEGILITYLDNYSSPFYKIANEKVQFIFSY